jgi:hypothetical protein
MAVGLLVTMEVFKEPINAMQFLMYNMKEPSTWYAFVKGLKGQKYEFTENLIMSKLSMSYIGFGAYRAMIQVS